jgi:multidrug efflux pump subunit AcrB
VRVRHMILWCVGLLGGVLRVVGARGAGANSRTSLGTTVFGGMIFATVLNLVFIPVLYVVIEGWRERRREAPPPRADQPAPEP